MSELEYKNVFITGGAGYVGSALVPYLINKGYHVSVYDLYLYGDVFKDIENHPNLTQIKGDIRNKKMLVDATKNCDALIHLACISNDPSYELDPDLGRSINYDAFFNVLDAAIKNNVKRFIYASTSSVYGIKDKKNVTEDDICKPLTDYSKFKVECENVLLEDKNRDMQKVILRPATVCGYARRLRLDLVVNVLTIHALINKKIKIFGGTQLRPNINIKDRVRVYETLLEADGEKIDGEIFNAGYQNLSVEEIGRLVKGTIDNEEIELEYISTDDIRSYHINSGKIKKVLGFQPKYDIKDAIQSLHQAYNDGCIVDGLNNPLYHNIKMMQNIGLK